MKFNVKSDTMIFANGAIKTIKTGEFDTTDKEEIAALSSAKSVDKKVTTKG